MMAAVPAYNPATDFSQDEAGNVSGRSTVRTDRLDAEFSALAVTIAVLISNASTIQRDDGELRDQIVKIHTLSTEVLILLGSNSWNPVGPWVTATVYAKLDVVTNGTGTYVATVAHTSGTFATDLAAGKWVLIFDSATLTASAITFTPTGTIAAANVQAAIAEAASEAAQKAANLSDLADVAVARTNISVFGKAETQQSAGTYAEGTGSGDAIIGAYTPAVTSLATNLLLRVRSPGPNTVTTPTFTPNSGVVTAKTIVKINNQALVPGDIAGANHVLQLFYDPDIDKWVLLNPAYNTVLPEVRGSDIAASATLTISSNGNYFYVTGADTVTTFSDKPAGTRISLRFNGSVILVHSSSLILQGQINSIPSLGEILSFRSEGSAIWSEESRRELPARIRTAAKLALANLAS